MSFYELVDQLFQLNCQQPVPPAAVKLYLYWLNEFNQQRWPAVLYRRAKQVYADLPCDRNTFVRAVDHLAERGLLRFDTDTRAWTLNYGPAAAWTAPDVVNFSLSAAPSVVHNALRDVPKSAESAHPIVKNSLPIRNRPTSSGVDQPPPAASAWVGTAAEKIAHAPLPPTEARLVPPVAEPPHAAESRPVAAAEQPADALAEYKTLALHIGAMWGFTPQKGQASLNRLYQFVRELDGLGHLAELRQQLAGYQNGGHLRPGERGSPRPHGFASWLGTPAYAGGPYRDGEWCSRDWPGLAAARLGTAGGAPPPTTRATTVVRNSPTQKW